MTPSHSASGNTTHGKKPDAEQVSLVARHEWTLVGLLAVLTFVLGCIGYGQTMIFVDQGGPHTWWDVGYASLQMFIFEAPDETAGWPLYLQIARALAPIIVLYTAAKAVWGVVEQQVALYGAAVSQAALCGGLRYRRNGLSYRPRLLPQFRQAGGG